MFYNYLVYKESTSKKGERHEQRENTVSKRGERHEQRENTVSKIHCNEYFVPVFTSSQVS